VACVSVLGGGSVCIVTLTGGWGGVFRMTSGLQNTHNGTYLVQIHTQADLVHIQCVVKPTSCNTSYK
jgi:hypothetical protein